MRIGMIWAEARGGAIGRGGAMPWHLPEDLAHFKRATLGGPVIMGRRTWESLPERFRPLPGRENLVVTRDPAYVVSGATVVPSLDAALAVLPPTGSGNETPSPEPVEGDGGPAPDTAWIIGGGRLYRAAMPFADELVVTRIELDVEGADTFAPEIGPGWDLADPGRPLTAANGLAYRFERWLRKRP